MQFLNIVGQVFILPWSPNVLHCRHKERAIPGEIQYNLAGENWINIASYRLPSTWTDLALGIVYYRDNNKHYNCGLYSRDYIVYNTGHQK